MMVIVFDKSLVDGVLFGIVIFELIVKDGKKLLVMFGVILLFEFKVFDFFCLFVYEFYVEGVKVGELCYEFIFDYLFGLGKSVLVFYFYNVYNKVFGEGMVLDNGGKVDYLIIVYMLGINM